MSWKLDQTHTQVHFSVRHMMISTVRGNFARFEANAAIDPENLESCSVTAKAFVDSISTGEKDRDNHLKSGDFFDVEHFPTMQLTSKKVVKRGDDVEVEVELTIRDVTRLVTLQGQVMGPAKDPWGNQRIGFSLRGDIDREEFGLTWNQALETGGVLVGKKVKLELDAQFVAS